MGKLPRLSSDEGLEGAAQDGFVCAPKRGKGSHVALYRTEASGKTWLVIVPKRRDLPPGTLRANIEQAGLTRTEFLKLL